MIQRIRIFIGYDGSSTAQAALDDLRRAGLPRDAEAVILAVSEVWLPAPPTSQASRTAEPSTSRKSSTPPATQAGAALAPISATRALAVEAKTQLQKQFPAWKIKIQEASGSPAREILTNGLKLKPHLIVVGSQGQSGLGRFLLGSVSQKVINEAPCTVRVSRGTAWKDGSPVRILIGHDGTQGSELAAEAVAQRVWPAGSAVRLITVVDPASDSVGRITATGREVLGSTPMSRDMVETLIKEASRKLMATQLSVSTRIEEGDPKRVLIADAEEWGADCIFLGASDASRALDRALLGSVATAVVARAHCSVEIVRGGY